MYAASPFRLLLLTAVTGVLAEDASAQQEAHAHSDDYGQWETLGQGVLSPDGQWLASMSPNPTTFRRNHNNRTARSFARLPASSILA